MTGHRLTHHLTDGTAAISATCECGTWRFLDGGRYVAGNPAEVKARHELHLLDVRLDQRELEDEAMYDRDNGIGQPS